MAIPSLRRLALIAVVGALTVHSSLAMAQKCDRRGVIASATDVYERVPQFVTGRGWQGNRIASLRQSTQVYVCTEQSADFGLSTKVWFQIAFKIARSGREEWSYGWVLKDAVTTGRAETGSRFALIGAAFAEPSPPNQQKAEWSLGAPPPAPPVADASSSSSSKAQGSATLGDLTVLYGPLFIGMLLGMLAKTAVDCLDAPSKKGVLVEHIRNGSIAILVSPIVFLGFLQAGEFGASTQAFVVLWLLAFQNGFFWQTVLKRNVAGEKKGA
ncbi:MAG TPA: hypothetical protein VLV56_04440 [Burkholderiales bacterium]|nr:hypothetical protein [Burkholderiales bacterium]